MKAMGSKIYRLIREANYDETANESLIIKGEAKASHGKKIINVEMSDRFISVWIGNQIKASKPNQVNMEVNLYVYNRFDKSLWIGAMYEPDKIIEGKILFQKSVEYMCAINSMKSFISDLFLIRPYDLRILEIIDMIGGKPSKSSVENFLRVLYKMIAND